MHFSFYLKPYLALVVKKTCQLLIKQPLLQLSSRLQSQWVIATISTLSWSISSPSTSAQAMPTQPNGNGWPTSTATPTPPTWATQTSSTTWPSPRTRARRACASTTWRRCCSPVALRHSRQTTNEPLLWLMNLTF